MVMNKPEFMGGVIQNKVDPQTGEVVEQSTRDHLSGTSVGPVSASATGLFYQALTRLI
jgi:hypothetical protein